MNLEFFFLLAAGVFIAYSNGANDVSKGIATLVGSGITDYKRAILWGTVWTGIGGLAGALLAGAMIETFGSGLLAEGTVPTLAAALATIAGAGLWVALATRSGLPVSTTLTIPWCTYTDPEIAHVGMYEAQARAKGIAVDTFQVPMSEVDRAIADGEEDGFVKIHVKKGTDQILGATIIAPHAGEMINEITLAIVRKIGLGSIANVIHPYPTQAEAIKKVADSYQRTRLTPFVKGLLKRWLH